jgi:hypothetical protein
VRKGHVRRSLGVVAAASLVAVAGLGASACSSGGSSSAPSRAAAEASAPADSVPTDGSNVRPDVPNLEIMQADNGTTVTMVVGQLADFPDMPEGNYEVTSTDDEVAQGVGLETLQIGAVKEGKASIVISDLDSGDPVLQFDVEVIPAD